MYTLGRCKPAFGDELDDAFAALNILTVEEPETDAGIVRDLMDDMLDKV